MENRIYVFVPFRVSGREAFFKAAADEMGKGLWEDDSTLIRSYFFKHLTDKVVAPANGETDRRCCVFLGLKEKSLGRKGIVRRTNGSGLVTSRDGSWGSRSPIVFT